MYLVYAQHVSTGSIRCFQRSLDTESTTTLVHALIASRIHYCNTVLAGSPRFITDMLQVTVETWKFDRGLSHLLHSNSKLH